MKANDGKRNGQPFVVRDVPWPALIMCATVIICTILGAGAYLIAHNQDLEQFRALLNTCLNIGQAIMVSVAALYGAAGYRKASQSADLSSQAVQQTNGGLEERMKQAAIAAYRELQEEG